MSIQKLIKEIQARGTQIRKEEQQLLQEIAKITSVEFAEQAADELDSKKHLYDFEEYISILQKLKTLLDAGMPNCQAIEMAQSGLNVEAILHFYNRFNRRR